MDVETYVMDGVGALGDYRQGSSSGGDQEHGQYRGDTANSVCGDAARFDVCPDECHGTFEGCARPEDLGHPLRL